MNNFHLTHKLCAALLFSIICAGMAHAQAQLRVYIAADRGSDFNPCTSIAPCRTIQHALDANVVQQGGHVVILDSGDYAPFIISNLASPPTVTSVTVEAPSGVVAGITSTGGDGASAALVLVGRNDKVMLRGLSLHGRAADNGITFASGRSLFVENCVVDGFTKSGLNVFRRNANDIAELFVTESVFRNIGSAGDDGTGIKMFSSGRNGLIQALLDHCRFENNGRDGVFAEENSHVTISHSVAAGNGDAGFAAQTCHADVPAELNIENSVATHNTDGVFTPTCGENGSSNSGTIRVSNSALVNNRNGIRKGHLLGAIYVAFSDISGNITGLSGPQIISLGNNRLYGNNTDGSFSFSLPQQ